MSNWDREGVITDLRRQAARHDWSPWQLASRIHQGARTPTLLMAWRLATGLTQARLAESVRALAVDAGSPCGPSTPSCQQISRWENGHDRPGAFYQGLLAAWYRTNPARLGLAGCLSQLEGGSPGPARHEEDDARQCDVPAGPAAPVLFQLDQVRRRIEATLRHVLPAAETDSWTEIASEHVAGYGEIPPSVLLEQLVPDLSDLADLVSRYPHQRDLTMLAARLTGLTGALHTDLGDDRSARKWLHAAARLAAMSGDPGTEYWIAVAQAIAATYPPKYDRVIEIAGRAAAALGPYRCAGAAQLTGLSARAYAEKGDAVRALVELRAASRAAARIATAQADEMFFGFPARAVLMYTSSVLTAIGDPAAWDAQADALACYPACDQVDRPLIQLDRAAHLARANDPEQAADIALRAVTEVPPQWRVPLLTSKARAVGQVIAAKSAQAGLGYQRALREAAAR